MASAISSRRAHSKTIALTDGGLLHARVWNGRGTPLVLLHGLLDSAEGWTELCRTMRRPCVAIDLPGFGRSDLPARPPYSSSPTTSSRRSPSWRAMSSSLSVTRSAAPWRQPWPNGSAAVSVG